MMSNIDPFLVFRIPPEERRASPAYLREELQASKQLAVDSGYAVPQVLALDASNILMHDEQLWNYCLKHAPGLVPARERLKAPVVSIPEGNAADQEYTQVDVDYQKRKGKKEHPPVVTDRPLLAPPVDKGGREYPPIFAPRYFYRNQ